MPAGVEVDVKEVQAVIRQFGARAKNLPMQAVASAVVTAVDELIQSEGKKSLKGDAWDPLLDSTIARNPKRDGGMLLQAGGILANMQPSVQGNTAIVESPAPYAGWHVEGTRFMEARDWTDVNMPKLLAEISEDVLTEIIKG